MCELDLRCATRTIGAAAILALTCSSTPAGEPVTIRVDSSQRFQTLVGWEAVAQAGQNEPGFEGWSATLFDLAVEDLGINRMRLQLVSGTESRDADAARYEITRNPRCRRYFTSNDDDDPRSLDWTGFDFSRLDHSVESVVLPMKRRLEARGEALYVNLVYVAFIAQCRGHFDYVHERPEEYAELVLAAFLHLRRQYGLTPDGLGILLEPDNVPGWTGTRVGEAIVAANERLSEAGFHPEFIAPGTTSLAAASTYVDEIVAVPGARELLAEISYHRYRGVSQRTLLALARRADRLDIRTSMLEKIGADVDTLYQDLAVGNVSAWQQFALAYPTHDNGAQLYTIVDGRPVIGRRTRYLRQYFRYLRRGAVRVAAEVDAEDVRALAFVDPHGRPVTVVHFDIPRPIVVAGLPPGVYGASLTTEDELGRELGPLQVGDHGVARLSVPAAGVLTVYPDSPLRPDGAS